MRTGILLWVRRLAAVLIFLLAAGVAFAAGLLTPYFLAARTTNILLLTISALASFAVLACAGTKLVLSCWATESRKLTVMLSGLLTIIFLGWLCVGVLRPSGSQFAKVVPYANTKYWQLPTGSVIAYSEYDPPQGVAVKPEAIVFLHGGPGVRQAPLFRTSMIVSRPTDFESFSMIRREAVFPAFYHICGITLSPVPSPIWKR